MKYPKLRTTQSSRQTVDTFGGYDHRLRIADGKFYDMKNMTSDAFPVLSPRKRRGLYERPNNPQGMIAKDALCYIDGTQFVMNQQRVDMGLSTLEADCPKQLTSIGAYVIIMPDKMYINTLDLSDWGHMEAAAESIGDIRFTLCNIEGQEYTGITAGAAEPENPENLDLWMDTASMPHTLKQYSQSSGMWVNISSTYVKISAEGIGEGFGQYDGVRISGITLQGLEDLNGDHVIWARENDYLLVSGILDTEATQTAAEGPVSVVRRMPNMDFLVESDNRLWGCRYGRSVDGEVVNAIYASKLGDFKNWNCFMGLSTDSYAASCGTDGPFTGAVTHLGYPMFFKENCVHKVYGNYPSNFQVQTTQLRGVQKGCSRSLAIVGEVLYYKGRSGVCAYDGSLPVEVSGALGDIPYADAVAGAIGSKYYISMEDTRTTEHSLFVYDTARAMWYREDKLPVQQLCAWGEELYAISGSRILALRGSGTPAEVDVRWMVQTGEIGIAEPDMKYVSRLTVRMAMEPGADAVFLAQYDLCDQWETLCRLKGTDLRSFSIPLRPRRCSFMRLRIEGKGNVQIYAITKTLEEGSELV